ncbi:patatin-like phospholipase family protein [Noviherbaspirillum agri]
MAKKVVVILQGGGALGAFQCGAWKVLAPFIRDNGFELAAVVGASIGAINAGVIVRHCKDEDGGAGALEAFWRCTLATPPAAFLPLPGEYARAWNGLLTSLLLGNRALFTPAYQNWNPVGEMFRFHMPMYLTRNATDTMARTVGTYREYQPLLAVCATDVQSGDAVLFDSARGAVTPEMFSASIAIPILFSPVEIDGRYYWDGEMRSNGLLPDVMALVRNTLPLEEDDDFLFIMVDMFRMEAQRLPTSTLQSQYRFLNIILGGKLKNDLRASETDDAHLRAMQRLKTLSDGEARSPLSVAVDEEYRRTLARRPAQMAFMQIGRTPFAYEHISRDFDYSPHYIERLMQQGCESANNAIDAYQKRTSMPEDFWLGLQGKPASRINGMGRKAPRLV